MNDTSTILPPSSAPTTMRRTLAPTTFTEALEFAKQLASSSMVPGEYRGKPENIVLAMQWGAELGLAPLQAIQNIAVINGKPSIYGDALLALVRGSAVCDDVIERFDGEGENFAAVCEARRKGKAPVVAQFSVADAKAAKLWGKAGPWQQYPRRMLQMRARGFALRDAFPDVLRGVITAEEARDYPVDTSKPNGMVDVTPRQDLDRFAALPATEAVDRETGEILPARDIAAEGRAQAAQGMKVLTAWYRSLADEDYDRATPLIGSRETPGELRNIARQADARQEDDFGLPAPPSGSVAAPSKPAPPQPAAERPGTVDDAAIPSGAGGAHQPLAVSAAALQPQPVDLASDEPDWPGYAAALVALIRRATPAECSELRLSELEHLRACRVTNGDAYRSVTLALADRAKAEAA